jgi:effector-binding domain-containing protein
VDYEVVLEHVSPRSLAAAWASAPPGAALGPLIIERLNAVWPMLRAQGVKTGPNVVVYFGGSPMRFAAGVETPDGFDPTDTVEPVTTPSGEVARTVHWGDYAEMKRAYAAIEAWCSGACRRQAGISWEVYGDWHEDPAQVRTDVYALLQPL